MAIITPIQRADYSSLAEWCAQFPDENRPATFWLNRFEHWWDQNPAFQPGWVRGYKLSEGSTICGMIGDIPRPMRLHGVLTTTSNFTTWRVAKSHRIASLGLYEAAIKNSGDRVRFGSTASDPAIRVLTKLQWIGSPLQEEIGASVFVLKPCWTVLRKAGFRLPVSRSVPESFSWLGKKGRVMIGSKIDASFETLWSQTEQEAESTIVRSAPAVAWFMQAPQRDRFCLGLYNFQHELCGFIILVEDGPARLLVLDLWCRQPRVEHGSELLRAAQCFGRQAGFEVLWVPHFHSVFAESASQSGFSLTRPYAVKLFVAGGGGIDLTSSHNSYWTGNLGDMRL